jgi:two-component system nitrogen regulation sensor histidine kinase NtrY
MTTIAGDTALSPRSGGTEHRRRNPGWKRVQTMGTWLLVLLAPVLVASTVAVLGPFTISSSLPSLRLVLLADLAYILTVAALVLARVARMVVARRARSAGSRLHLRLSTLFAGIALVPAITVAAFAVITINIGLEGWFSDRVRNVVGNSLAAAEAYQAEQERNLATDAQSVARALAVAVQGNPFIAEGALRQVLSAAQADVQRGLRVAFVVDSDGTLRLRGERSYLFDFVPPQPSDMRRAAEGELVLVRDWAKSEFRAIVPIRGLFDRFLYITREVDGEILSLLDETQVTISLYNQLERDRGRVLFNFGLIYIAFAIILILAAIWLGIWFAEGLARPVGRLAGAAERVGAGDLDARVPEERGDDEIATMGRVFNQMTRQLKAQRSALLENTRQIEARRRLFDSVLGSVTAGVIGLNPEGHVEFVNRAATALTRIDGEGAIGAALSAAVPELAPLLTRLQEGGGRFGRVQDEVRLSRDGRLESLLVRVSERRNMAGDLEGFVVAFDDVTDLVSAQRMAAWGDVARRIAHEIKNPLTPIQLSADRIKRKFARQLPPEEAQVLEQLTDVIVRQTNDLRRIVDEFSRFARMPEPDRRPHDLVALVRDAVTLQEAALDPVELVAELPHDPLMLDIDATMITQALTNLIKNGGEAIESLQEKGAPEGYAPRIELHLRSEENGIVLTIADNGIGLPEDRARLFEPYVTTREKGTGLGLPIVKKIIEEHGGTLALLDAPVFAGASHRGALAEVRLPLLGSTRNGRIVSAAKDPGHE